MIIIIKGRANGLCCSTSYFILSILPTHTQSSSSLLKVLSTQYIVLLQQIERFSKQDYRIKFTSDELNYQKVYNHYYGIQNRQGYLIQNTKYLKECPSGKMEDNIHGQATTEHLAVVTESSRLSLVVPDPVVTDSGHLSPIVSDPSRLSLIVTEPGRLSPSVGSDPDRLSPIQVVDPPRHLFKKTSPSNLLTLYLPRWDPIFV